MADRPDPLPQPIRERLAGQQILVTGSTGFLAKAFIEKLLRAVDTIGGLHLLVRPRPDGTSAAQRLREDVLRSPAFNRLRASLGDSFDRLCDEKLHVVSGDLTKEHLGLEAGAYASLTRRITLIVNSAATVTFDERLDHAIELNTLGPSRLLRFARDCGNVPFLHVSTCYVCGARRGVVVEDFSAPEPARESLPRRADSGTFDLDRLIGSMVAETDALRTRWGADTESGRRQLIDAGMRLARHYGWNDTYTFTKWIGEQLLIRDRGDVPLVIFRPAIIESGFEEPTPGWIDGLRMADPIIVAYGRGKLNEFPGRPEISIDFIPVDFVANAMIATLPVGDAHPAGLTVYQCASSERRPLRVGDLLASLERAFVHRPMHDDHGRPIRAGRLRLIDGEAFVRRWQAKQRRMTRYQTRLKRLGLGRRRLQKLSVTARQIEQVIYFAKIYSPYTHLDCRFADDNLRAAAERLHPDDRATFPFDPERIDWEDYIVNRHVPGICTFVLGGAAETSPRIAGVPDAMREETSPPADLRSAANLFAAFQRSVGRFSTKPALQIRRDGRWVRYTYDEALRASGTIMRRFQERGLAPGDRLAICGENGPEWGLAYLAAIRAGLTAVPLDPQLPAAEVWSAVRFVKVKLVAAGATTFDALQAARDARDPELVRLREPFVPPSGASRDPVPEPVLVGESATASILFTSGTTIAPRVVPLTHANFLANAQALLEVQPVYSTDEFLSVLPMYHAFEFTAGFLVPLVCGATVTYVEQLKGAEIVSAMRATGTTIMMVVPRLLRMFHDSIESTVAAGGWLRRGLFRFLLFASRATGRRFASYLFAGVHRGFGGRLRMFVCGGSRLEPDLFDAFARLGFAVYEGYGLTETSPVLSVNPRGRPRAGSVGPPLPNVEVEIRNRNLEDIGELWVRGPSVMSGYLDNPAATREVLVDGWLRTGDLGRRDADGYLYLTGRSKDLIVTGAGKNVYPDEVESRYRDLPNTKEFCVFGVGTAGGLGDAVHAVVVIDEDAAPGLDRSSLEREIRLAAAAIGESLPPYQRIAALHFWDRELPKTSTLKAKRGLIREMVCAGSSPGSSRSAEPPRPEVERGDSMAADPSLANGDAFAVVRRILARHAQRPEHAIDRHMHLLLDLGIDSIGKIDLIGAIESRFGMEINDAEGAGMARVSDLLRVIGDRRPREGVSLGGAAWTRFMGVNTVVGANGARRSALLPARWLARGALSVLMNTYIRVQAQGREHIPDTGPFILAPNHSSHLDSPAVLEAVGGKRRVWVAGAEDYFFDTSLKRFVFGRLFDTIPFDRHSDGIAGLRRCADALARGDGLLMFPEGTRSLNGRRQSFKIGVAVLAVERQVPIVPVRIERAFELLAKGRRFVRPGVVTVTLGEAIRPSVEAATADHYAAFQTLTQRLERAVDALGHEVRG